VAGLTTGANSSKTVNGKGPRAAEDGGRRSQLFDRKAVARQWQTRRKAGAQSHGATVRTQRTMTARQPRSSRTISRKSSRRGIPGIPGTPY